MTAATHLPFPSGPPEAGPTVAEVVNAYIDDLRTESSGRTMEERVRVLTWFVADFGERSVASLIPLDLKRWIMTRREWRSLWTRSRIHKTVQRAFNWAAEMRLTPSNPLRGLKFSQGDRQRPMTDAEFRAALKAVGAQFRRVLLFLAATGCRPGELSALRWPCIDWERSVAILAKHKTSKKTRRPRVIALPPVAIKLLRWIERHPTREASTELLRAILANGPQPAKAVIAELRAAGIRQTAQWAARRRLQVRIQFLPHAVTKRKVRHYVMPAASAVRTRPLPGDYIFLNDYGRPWQRATLCVRMQAVRQRAGISDDCKLYGLRHRFGTEGIRRGVPLKIVSELMGHTDIRTTEHYVHIADDFERLVEATTLIASRASHRDGRQSR